VNTFADPLRRALQVAPRAVAVSDGEYRLDYATLWDRCTRLAAALTGLGLAPGDRVAILANNSHHYLETYIAVPAGAFVVVPLNTRHANPELRYALEDSGAAVLITDRDPRPFTDLVRHVVRLPGDYETLITEARPAGFAAVDENDLAGLFYTGGTTGASKGVMLSHRNLIANAFHWMAVVPHTSDEHILIMAPMFHAAGTNGVLAAVWHAAQQITLPVFDPAHALDLIERERVTMTLGVPTMLAAIAEEQLARPRDTSSLRVLVHGGSPIASEVIRCTHQALPSANLFHTYGATELSPLCAALPDEENLIDSPRLRSCGRSMPGCEIRICADDGAELLRGEIGEVVVRGANVMQGYWNKPAETAAVLCEGAYWTGDLGYMDDDGYIYLVDRSKDMIVSGGENVYSTEVEEVLYRHPAVLEAAVFGVPDDKWGEAVHAVIVPRAGHRDIDPAALIAFAREYIAAYKVPKAIDVVSEPLPKSGPGKVLKRELRAPFWAGHGRAVN
jgi:long-chain acyl-CoA synthetase